MLENRMQIVFILLTGKIEIRNTPYHHQSVVWNSYFVTLSFCYHSHSKQYKSWILKKKSCYRSDIHHLHDARDGWKWHRLSFKYHGQGDPYLSALFLPQFSCKTLNVPFLLTCTLSTRECFWLVNIKVHYRHIAYYNLSYDLSFCFCFVLLYWRTYI